MEKGIPYKDLATKATSQLLDALREEQSTLTNLLITTFNGLLADFDCTFVNETFVDPARDALRSDVADFIDQAKTMMDGPLRANLARAIRESTDIPPEDMKWDLDAVKLWQSLGGTSESCGYCAFVDLTLIRTTTRTFYWLEALA